MPQKTAEDVLKNIPFGSREWYRARKDVIKRLEPKYKGQYVLCIEGRLLHPEWDIHKAAPVQSWNSAHLGLYFNPTAHFFHDNIKFVKRTDAEYNFEFKQINVFAVIRNDTQVLVLKKKTNGELGLPGGHVDFDVDAYRLTPEQILQKALKLELKEELTESFSAYVPEKPSFMLNTNNEWNDLFHFGVIYDIYIPEKTDLKELKVKSNEKERHSVKVMDIATLHEESKAHQWIQLSLNYLTQTEEGKTIYV